MNNKKLNVLAFAGTLILLALVCIAVGMIVMWPVAMVLLCMAVGMLVILVCMFSAIKTSLQFHFERKGK